MNCSTEEMRSKELSLEGNSLEDTALLFTSESCRLTLEAENTLEKHNPFDGLLSLIDSETHSILESTDSQLLDDSM